MEENGRLYIHKQLEDAEGDKNEAQIIAKRFQEPKEVPGESPTFDGGVLFIATRRIVEVLSSVIGKHSS